MILRNNKGRSWEVRLNKHTNRLYIGIGLRAFLKDNGMKEGDEIKFELVEKEKDKPPIVNFFRTLHFFFSFYRYICKFYMGIE